MDRSIKFNLSAVHRGLSRRMLAGCCIAAIALLPMSLQASELKPVSLIKPQFRRPIAVRRLNETTAIVANRCGTLSVIDLPKWSVVAEFSIGGTPTDLAVSGERVFVTDAQRSKLLLVSINRDSARMTGEIALPTHPVSVRVSDDGTWCSVASLWARKLTLVRLPNAKLLAPEIIATVDLPFAPREQIQVKQGKHVIVADAFSGRLAVVDTALQRIEAVHSFGAHNIRGLALNSDQSRLLMSQQLLNDLAVPRRSDIIWGVMIDNLVRLAKLDQLLKPGDEAMFGSQFIDVGYAGQGAGDPDSLFVDSRGRTIVALAGVGEVTVIEPDGKGLRRIAVGRRPTSLMPVSDGRFVVANELSDSLTLVDIHRKAAEVDQPSTYAVEKGNKGGGDTYGGAYSGSYGNSYLDRDMFVSHLNLGLGATPEYGPAERGELLFFDARVSHASWFSCHSCHTDGHSNGGMADTFGDSSTGAPKRVLSLLGVGETGPWGWDGKKQLLPAQVHQSVNSTMKGRGISDAAANDLVAFLKTLKPPPPFAPATSPADAELVEQGRNLFKSLNCSTCHAGHTLTSNETYDVGLTDKRGLREFSPPSLRGVGHRYGLFHDMQAQGVEDVVIRFRHQLPRKLTSEQQQALIRYLKSL
ncbi:MAG: SMP-30/gluconolactonase/LRE family protein [Planctomycetota bacterium]|nr:SMP-30/gluconolactonase/LRE family protein [Planctomycetota bacterium]